MTRPEQKPISDPMAKLPSFDLLSLEGIARPRMRRIISTLLFLGCASIIAATYLTAYYIPHLDSEIAKLDRDFADCQAVNVGLQSIQSMGSISYDLTTMLDLFPHAPQWIKDDLLYETKKSQVAYLELLYSPSGPSGEDRIRWQKMSFNDLENERIERTSFFIEAIRMLTDQRSATLGKKATVRFVSVVLQLIGIAMTAAGTLLRERNK